MSEKKHEEFAHYAELRRRFLIDHPSCKVCEDAKEFFQSCALYDGSPSVINRASGIHHMGRRYGKWLLDTRYFLAVCHFHHEFIERHGDWARSLGYLLTPAQRRLIIPTPTPL